MPRRKIDLTEVARQAIQSIQELSEDESFPDEQKSGLYGVLSALQEGVLCDDDWSTLDELDGFVKDELRQKLQSLAEELFDPEEFQPKRPLKWTPLSNDPRRFKNELDSHLSAIRECMLALYDVGEARGRPRTEKLQARDKRIYELRLQGKTFGQIGIQRGISDKTAGRAFKREQKRREERLESIAKRYAALRQLFNNAAS